jgi:hypothetical protein
LFLSLESKSQHVISALTTEQEKESRERSPARSPEKEKKEDVQAR